MSESESSKTSRRDLLKTVAGAAAVGAAALRIPLSAAAAQEQLHYTPPGTDKVMPAEWMDPPFDVIWRKSNSPDDPSSGYPGFAPGSRVEDGMRIERDVAVKMRDGVTIYTDVYRPDGAENVPAIIAWSPYGKQPGKGPREPRGVGLTPEGDKWGLVQISRYTKAEGPDPVWWTKRGYAVINPDARGAYKSEGNCRVADSGEGKDFHDLVEWVGTQSWCNGKVGASGNSWLAQAQWYMAAERPAHLAAIAPWEGWSDFFNEMLAPGGIPEVGFNGRLIAGRTGMGYTEDCMAMLQKYPLMNAYWEDKVARLERINVPASITVNFKHFHALGSLNGFRRIASKDKWLRIVPTFEWPDFNELAHLQDLQRFFDHYLRGIDNSWPQTPRVRMAVLDPGGLDSVNLAENEWPLARTKYEKLYLDASSKALSAEPVSQESQTQHDQASGTTNFVYRFDRETQLTGYLKLRLWVEAADADDLDLFIYVQKLDHKGEFLPSYVMGHVHPGAQGWLRVSHRELDTARSTPSEPVLERRRTQMLRPKEIVPVEIAIWPTSMLWHPNQQLRVVVSGHLIDTRGPDWWEGFTYDSLTRGTCIIHTGGKYDSHLLVPRIPTTAPA